MSASSPPSQILQQRPSPTSPAVQQIIRGLTPHLRLPALLKNLHTLSASLRAAQAHTTSFNALHLRLHRITLLTTALSTRTAQTLSAFRRAATTSLDNIDLVADLLSDDLQPVATNLLSAESAVATRLAAQSAALALQFDTAATQLTEALALAVQTRVDCEARRTALSTRVTNRWTSLRHARETVKAAQDAITDAERRHDLAKEREDRARMTGSVLKVANVAAVVGSVLSTRSTAVGLLGASGTAALAARVDEQALQAREERAVHLKLGMEARKDKLDSSKNVSELVERLRAVRNEETLAEDALAALEEAILALRSLAGVMVGAESFWSATAGECHAEGVESLLGLVQSGEELEDADRKALWQSPKLGSRMKDVQIKYVALEIVCDECLAGMGPAMKGLYDAVGDGSGDEVDLENGRASCNLTSFGQPEELVAEDIGLSRKLLDVVDGDGNG